MYAKNVFAAGALLSVVAAVPMVKRDVVWVTETDEAVVTVPVTTTVWVNPGESIPTASASSSASHYGHHRSHVTTHVQSTVTVSSAAPASTEESSVESSAPAASSYVAPTTSTTEEAAPTTPSSTSVYVAPTTSSTSEYVAPTPTQTPSSTYAEPSTTSTSAAPAATSSASSGSANTGDGAPGTEYTGDLTWYDVGLGACGITSSPSDKIVAIAESLFDEYTPTSGIHAGNPNGQPELPLSPHVSSY